ncbi:MAG: glycosyltransferase family 4 protein [Nitrospirae bacterium]|nr:glycosyltransferase family 4 protein [Nitrospirota bacterium]
MPDRVPQVVFFHAHAPDSIGGNNTYLVNTVKYLSRQLHGFAVLMPQGALQLEGSALTVHYYSRGHLNLPIGVRYFHFLARLVQLYVRSRKLLQKLQPDIVISNHAMVMIVAYVTRRQTVRIFLPGSLSGMDMKMDAPNPDRNLLKRWLQKLNPWGVRLTEKTALRIAHKIVVNTSFLKELIAEIYGKEYTKHVKIIPNGVDIERYSVTAGSRTKEDSEKYIVLSAFRLMPSKNWHLILETCSHLGPNIEWWIAGDGPDLEELKSVINRYGLSERVKVLGARGDMAAIYGQADVFVHLSRYDNYPTVVMEASVSGLPVVLLDPSVPGTYTGYAELINRIPKCVTVMDNGASVADAINGILADLPSRQEISAEASKLNNHERHVDALLSLIQDELDKRGHYC